MKEYVITWECNNFGFHRKLDDKYRKLIETKFTCYHLADLFNSLNEFLKPFQEAYSPEVISIKEV